MEQLACSELTRGNLSAGPGVRSQENGAGTPGQGAAYEELREAHGTGLGELTGDGRAGMSTV